MKRLYLFELKKIFSGKLIWVGIAMILLMSVGNFTSMNRSDISYEQKIAENYKGVLKDDTVQRMLHDFLPTEEQLAQWQGIPVAYIGLNDMQQAVHLFFANDDGTWNGEKVSDVFGDDEIQVGYYSGWIDLSRKLVKVNVALAVLTIIMIAPVFAREYEGMDQLLLTASCGKTSGVTARLLAGFSASLLVTMLILSGNLAAAFVFLGREGLDSSLLFCGFGYRGYVPCNISCGTMLLHRILVLFPIYQLQFSDLMSVGQINGDLLYAVWAFPVSLAVAAAGALMARSVWNRHQVK